MAHSAKNEAHMSPLISRSQSLRQLCDYAGCLPRICRDRLAESCSLYTVSCPTVIETRGNTLLGNVQNWQDLDTT